MHYAGQSNRARDRIVDLEVRRLEKRRPRPARSASVSRRFSVIPTINGFEVADEDGRPVATRSFQHEADGIVANLNKAVSRGPQAVSDALLSI